MGRREAHEKLQKLRKLLRLDQANPVVRKIVVGVIGGICLIAGIAMILLPGPAFIFIPLGLLLLASEFKWAKRWAQKGEQALQRGRRNWRLWRKRRARAATVKQ